MNAAEFFVIVAGQKQQVGSVVAMVAARSAAEAHRMAADNYRREYRVAPSVHVDTTTVHRTADQADAVLFHARLMDRIESDRASAAASPLSQKDGEG